MPTRDAPSRLEALAAYTLSSVTTLLWVGCVLPSGSPPGTGLPDDTATPMHRATVLIVPALLLLVLMPVGCVLSRRRRGMRAVLASTDAFILVYAAAVLIGPHLVGRAPGAEAHAGFWGYVRTHLPETVALLLLLVLAVVSAIETWRCTRSADREVKALTHASGLRLALCLLVLIVPLHFLLRPDVERASLLAPFLFVALSAGGARLATTARGLRRTAAVLQMALAAHVLITLRFTIFRAEPKLETVSIAGRVTMGLALATLAIAVIQLLLFLRRGPGPAREAAPVPA